MVFDPSEFLVGGVYDVLVADVGSTFPTTVAFDVDDIVADGWAHLGLTTDAGARFTYDLSVVRVFSSQRIEVQRLIRDTSPKKVEYDLQQWNVDNLDLALGGVDISDVDGETRFDPKEASFLNEKALLLRCTDGDEQWMVGYPRTLNTKSAAFAWTKKAEAALPIGSEVMGTTGESPYFMQTNAAAIGS